MAALGRALYFEALNSVLLTDYIRHNRSYTWKNRPWDTVTRFSHPASAFRKVIAKSRLPTRRESHAQRHGKWCSFLALLTAVFLPGCGYS